LVYVDLFVVWLCSVILLDVGLIGRCFTDGLVIQLLRRCVRLRCLLVGFALFVTFFPLLTLFVYSRLLVAFSPLWIPTFVAVVTITVLNLRLLALPLFRCS
jgi:hypothetical protein